MKTPSLARFLVVAALSGASKAFAPQPLSRTSNALSGLSPLPSSSSSSSPSSLHVWNPFLKQDAVPAVEVVVKEDPEPGPLEAKNYVAAAVWASLVIWAFGFAPGTAGSPADTEMMNTLISQPTPRPEGMNELWFTVWNAFVVVPTNLAFLAAPAGRGQRLPPAPFLAGSFAFGYFSLGPYFSTRTVRTEALTKEDLGFFGRNVFENKFVGAALALLSISIPFSSDLVGCDLPSTISGFSELFSESRFVAVATVDIALMSVVSAVLVAEDAVRRGLEDKSLPIGLATLLFPVIGPSVWLAARPSLEEQ